MKRLLIALCLLVAPAYAQQPQREPTMQDRIIMELIQQRDAALNAVVQVKAQLGETAAELEKMRARVQELEKIRGEQK